jgi:hypothetical protein
MRIRLLQAGFTTFTGELGHIDFVDGASVSSNPPADFVRALATVMEVGTITTEADPDATPDPIAEVVEVYDATSRTQPL